MSDPKVEAGKRWTVKTLEEFGQPAGFEWGTPWVEVTKRRGSKVSSQQLILIIGSRRKVLWIPVADLREAGSQGDGRDVACARIREQLGSALSNLVSRAG